MFSKQPDVLKIAGLIALIHVSVFLHFTVFWMPVMSPFRCSVVTFLDCVLSFLFILKLFSICQVQTQQTYYFWASSKCRLLCKHFGPRRSSAVLLPLCSSVLCVLCLGQTQQAEVGAQQQPPAILAPTLKPFISLSFLIVEYVCTYRTVHKIYLCCLMNTYKTNSCVTQFKKIELWQHPRTLT